MRRAALLLLPAIACAEIPADKIGHFAAGATAAAAVPFFIDHPKAPEFGLAAGGALGIGKEIYDARRPDRRRAKELRRHCFCAGSQGLRPQGARTDTVVITAEAQKHCGFYSPVAM